MPLGIKANLCGGWGSPPPLAPSRFSHPPLSFPVAPDRLPGIKQVRRAASARARARCKAARSTSGCSWQRPFDASCEDLTIVLTMAGSVDLARLAMV
jgi:hypothetical protein